MDDRIKKIATALIITASIIIVAMSLLKLELQGVFCAVDITERFNYPPHVASAFQAAGNPYDTSMPKIDILENSIEACRSIVTSAAEKSIALGSYIMKHNKNIPHSVAMEEAVAFLRYSSLYGVPLDLAVAVAHTESHFKPNAKSSHGALGVMQVTWRVHKNLLSSCGFTSSKELYDPSMGIKAGCILLSRYIRHNGDEGRGLKTALGHYYGGPPEVYWRRISANLRRYRKYEAKRLKR